MTILFVGTVSGANVFAYAKFGLNFPYTILMHGVLFGLITVGSIMVMKALFDMALNDKIEMYLLDRRISAYWERIAKDEQQRKKMQESLKSFQSENQTKRIPLVSQPTYEGDSVGADFLATLQ
tara:strand:+ start:335 stop:703 length:369 start_codon:yes stop_codon:yes gene_type:complete